MMTDPLAQLAEDDPAFVADLRRVYGEHLQTCIDEARLIELPDGSIVPASSVLDHQAHRAPTRVVCPHTGELPHPLTVAALDRYAPGWEQVPLAVDDVFAYCEALRRLWTAGEDFVLIEHDIEIHAGVLPSFDSCPRPWCGHGYARASAWAGANGCTRFRSSALTGGFVPPTPWWAVATAVGELLVVAGHRLHLHDPMVLNHKRYDGFPRCGCGGDCQHVMPTLGKPKDAS